MRKLLASLVVVVAGFGNASAAMANDGDLDTSWGGTGEVTFAAGVQNIASVAREYGSGKVIVSGINGATGNSIDTSFLARYNNDGSLDMSCGGSGYITHRGPSDFLVSDMAVLADGSVVLVGHDTSNIPIGKVLKFDPLCQLDSTFGVAGVVEYTERQGLTLSTVALGPGGTLVIGGNSAFAPIDGGDSRPFIMRLTADGSFDTGFGDSSSGRWVASAI